MKEFLDAGGRTSPLAHHYFGECSGPYYLKVWAEREERLKAGKADNTYDGKLADIFESIDDEIEQDEGLLVKTGKVQELTTGDVKRIKAKHRRLDKYNRATRMVGRRDKGGATFEALTSADRLDAVSLIDKGDKTE
jgi:hypothetical protein